MIASSLSCLSTFA